jgi:protein-S-isoprenylcysteine O-methyltransferase Ste14
MFLRALLAFLALPGVVAFLLPALFASGETFHFNLIGAAVFATGLFVLLWCAAAFYFTGKGTLAPWAPPQRLVTVGLYRFSRNPMYVGVLLILLGWALLFQSTALAWYAAAVAVAFHLRVVFGEEPWLARVHGAEWSAYERSVPRWLWRLPRKRGGEEDG